MGTPSTKPAVCQAHCATESGHCQHCLLEAGRVRKLGLQSRLGHKRRGVCAPALPYRQCENKASHIQAFPNAKEAADITAGPQPQWREMERGELMRWDKFIPSMGWAVFHQPVRSVGTQEPTTHFSKAGQSPWTLKIPQEEGSHSSHLLDGQVKVHLLRPLARGHPGGQRAGRIQAWGFPTP